MTTMDSKSRFPAFGMGPNQSTKNQIRASTKPIGSVWNTGTWGNSGAVRSGAKSVGQDSGRIPNELADSSPITEPLAGSGSRSLLPSSESESRATRQTAWKNAGDEVSTSLPIGNTSPLLRQKSNHSTMQTFGEGEMTETPYLSITAASGHASSQSSQSNFLDPNAGNYVLGMGDPMGSHQSSRHNSEEQDQYAVRGMLNSREHGLNLRSERTSVGNNVSGYNSSAASRSGSQPPSRSEVDYSGRQRGDPRNYGYNRPGQNPSAALRSNISGNAIPFVSHAAAPGQARADQLSPAQLDHLAHYFDRLQMNREEMPPEYVPAYENPAQVKAAFAQGRGTAEPWHGDDGLSFRPDQLSPTGSGTGSIGSTSNQHRNLAFQQPFSHSPNSSDTRMSHQSPFYSTSGTPPPPYHHQSQPRAYHSGVPASQAALLERKLQGLQEQQQQQQLQHRPANTAPLPNPLQFRNHIPHHYDIQSQNILRMNPLGAAYYPPHLLSGHHVPRGPARDIDAGQQVRSPLLEEFRNNSKTNKRYELKDIYHHIVEFSGDQHGSRFIQQKLETANSDEKDQVFRELLPNSRQLMTDVFGNYVIQKFFEHGNQAQKKLLANQMRNHVLALSMQIYGCRVVQKALEHILTDQQAQLVTELKNDVMKCVKDQNGNHVIQKAIERVPAEHIQFIIKAFHGRVQESATHPYGCRVIQRMLEYCEEPTRIAVLQELHNCASSLIVDQYGNYVTQHVIEHGKATDRGKIIHLITLQLVNYSKHKFASNVVEKSIQFGSPEERQSVVGILSVINEKGESPVQGLIRDQYGNYVMQKLITQLRGAEWSDFIELIKVQISLLKRFSFGNGKQIAAVEKVLYSDAFVPQSLQNHGNFPPSLDTSVAPTPPLATSDTQSPQSSSVPSTYANSIDVTSDSRKSSGSNNISTILSPPP